MVDLQKFKQTLDDDGFEVELKDNLLAASKNIGSNSIEVTTDAGGGCLVKKTQILPGETKKIKMLGKSVYEINNQQRVSQIRVVLSSDNDLETVLEYANQ